MEEAKRKARQKTTWMWMKPRIFYLGFHKQVMKPGKRKHDGIMTLAVRINKNNILQLGFSFCSPRDNFCRAEGRKYALARMRKHPIQVLLGEVPITPEQNRAILPHTVFPLLRAICTKDFEFLHRMDPDGVVDPEALLDMKRKQWRIPEWAQQWCNKHTALGSFALGSLVDNAVQR